MSRENESAAQGTEVATHAGVRARGWSGSGANANVSGLAATWAALETCERLMVAGNPRSVVRSRLMSEHGIARFMADRMQGVVAMRWSRDGQREGAAQRLDRYRAIVEGAIAAANEYKITVCTGKLDDGTKTYEVVEQPDTKAVIAGVALLAKLNGDLGPPDDGDKGKGKSPELPSGEVVVLSEAEVEAELQAHRRAQRDG